MGVTNTTYYGLVRVREQSPEAKDWAAVDHNPETISKLLKFFEAHKHTAATAIEYPGAYALLTAPTVTPQGVVGSTTYSYYVVAKGTIPKTTPTGTTATGNATLTVSNFNRVTWAAVAGATGYDVIRASGGATQGSISTTVAAGTTQFDDTGIAALTYVDPTLPTISEIATGGIMTPGVSIGVRLAYINSFGLETQASPEKTFTVTTGGVRPLAPTFVSKTSAANTLSGGTYIYVLTKKKGSGETTISDVLAVEIPYDSTYNVALSFDAINTYTDGTDGLNLYRAEGLNSTFQLVTTITTTSQTTFTDTNTIAAGNQNVQPPTTNTFGAQKKLRITWSGLSHPTGATFMRVYVTQQTGVWSTNHLLSEVDLAAPPTFIDYVGNETLQTGWPKESSQIPAMPAKLDLSTEATGAPTLTANMNFAQFQALNLRFHQNAGTPATPVNGQVYYDTSTNNVRAFINSAWVNWGTTTATAYVHPVEEVGGHVAANVKFVAASAVTAKTIFDTVRNADGTRKTATSVYRQIGATASPTYNLATPALIPEMSYTVTPDFINQYFECDFSALFQGAVAGSVISYALEYDGITQADTVRSVTVPSTNAYLPVSTHMVYQFLTITNKVIRVLWWTDTVGAVTAVADRRSLTIKALF